MIAHGSLTVKQLAPHATGGEYNAYAAPSASRSYERIVQYRSSRKHMQSARDLQVPLLYYGMFEIV
jgi:hypothetical protein